MMVVKGLDKQVLILDRLVFLASPEVVYPVVSKYNLFANGVYCACV